tara:strand:+ start:52 stop:966 length:915 start_codon:yes stop_codon:yes gene_type:complete
MRTAFAKEVSQIASIRNDVVLLSGDIGNRMFDEFKLKANSRFFNCGIAESNMMSVAAGMALCGLRPIIYTITPFTTLRCLEQIKIGTAYHKVPVIIIGTGSGLSYAELGATHHSLDDIALIRSIPDIRVLAPCDSKELKAFLNQSLDSNNPTYIRIGKKGEPILTKDKEDIQIGKANVLKNGNDVIIIGIGPILNEALEAANDKNINAKKVSIVSMGSVKPLDKDFLHQISKRNFKKWIILEEHSKIGGLGSAIIEWKEDNKIETPEIIRIAAPDQFIHKLGNQKYVREQIGIDAKSILKQIID